MTGGKGGVAHWRCVPIITHASCRQGRSTYNCRLLLLKLLLLHTISALCMTQ